LLGKLEITLLNSSPVLWVSCPMMLSQERKSHPSKRKFSSFYQNKYHCIW